VKSKEGKQLNQPKCLLTSFQEKGTEAQNNVVCANAGMAIATVTKCTPLDFN
jgi:anthranilate phosphoribosyltransferase